MNGTEDKFIEGLHFYYNESNFIVFTEMYHLERGYCCGYGCRHCPYSYENVYEPLRSKLIHENKQENQ
jgi:hypothetical protein